MAGVIAAETDRYTADATSIDDQIASMERRILQDQDRLTASFVAFEQAQSLIQSELAAFTNTFGSSSSTSSIHIEIDPSLPFFRVRNDIPCRLRRGAAVCFCAAYA